MYAIIETGGKQYKVEQGDMVSVEKLGAEAGETVTFDKVLAVSDDNGLKAGTPYLEGTSVTGEVVENGKGKKVIVFKYKPKKDSKSKQGHRQPYTMVEIKAIGAAMTSLKFMPTGGINAKNVVEYLKSDKIFCCGGSWMVKGDMIKAGEFDKIKKLVAEAAAIVKEVRG